MNKKNIFLVIITITMLLIFLLIGPMDIFSHGFFSNEPEYDQIAEEDFLGVIDLSEQNYRLKFIPQKKHFVGFKINLINLPEDRTGILHLSVFDDSNEEGILLDDINIDIRDITPGKWFCVHLDKQLKSNYEYVLCISAQKCDPAPYLQVVNEDYVAAENVGDGLLISYAYAEPTFTFQLKVLFILIMLSIWSLIYSILVNNEKYGKGYRFVGIFVLLVVTLSWNYMYNSMDNKNETFEDFQYDSEALVISKIKAELNDVRAEVQKNYGLGIYIDVLGSLQSSNRDILNNEEWINGYSIEKPAIAVKSSAYTRWVATEGNSVGFSNGDIFQINDIVDNGTWRYVYLASDNALRECKYGSVSDIIFYDGNNMPLPKGVLIEYSSQFGLQGKFFKYMAHYMSDEELIYNLNLMCSVAAAIIFVCIVMILAYKYNWLYAGCFFVVFWLSPWIVNFARNLYWVEFTWFVPMAAGLFCTWKVESCKCRVISYCIVFISVLGKCLCGYEYISAIMLGALSFPLIDLVETCIVRDRNRKRLLLKIVFIIGIAATLGFVVAIIIHARIEGNGNIISGIKSIIYTIALKRTIGADLNSYGEAYWSSFNASIWQVFCRYFHFNTEIITGINGNLFPLLCIIPLCILANDYKKKEIKPELVSMYIVFFVTSVSWFVLAKSHSEAHTHMNYVLWYFGFVQVCVYIICDRVSKVFEFIKRKEI